MLPHSLTRFSRAIYCKLKARKLLRLGAVLPMYIPMYSLRWCKWKETKQKTNNVISVNKFIRILVCLQICIYPFFIRTYLLSKKLRQLIFYNEIILKSVHNIFTEWRKSFWRQCLTRDQEQSGLIQQLHAAYRSKRLRSWVSLLNHPSEWDSYYWPFTVKSLMNYMWSVGRKEQPLE